SPRSAAHGLACRPARGRRAAAGPGRLSRATSRHALLQQEPLSGVALLNLELVDERAEQAAQADPAGRVGQPVAQSLATKRADAKGDRPVVDRDFQRDLVAEDRPAQENLFDRELEVVELLVAEVQPEGDAADEQARNGEEPAVVREGEREGVDRAVSLALDSSHVRVDHLLDLDAGRPAFEPADRAAALDQ